MQDAEPLCDAEWRLMFDMIMDLHAAISDPVKPDNKGKSKQKAKAKMFEFPVRA